MKELSFAGNAGAPNSMVMGGRFIAAEDVERIAPFLSKQPSPFAGHFKGELSEEAFDVSDLEGRARTLRKLLAPPADVVEIWSHTASSCRATLRSGTSSLHGRAAWCTWWMDLSLASVG